MSSRFTSLTLQPCRCPDEQLPYPSIVAYDTKAAILHYRQKRTDYVGNCLLIDAGSSFQGYAADVTRTYLRSGVSDEFASLIHGVERLQQNVCQSVQAGVQYVELQRQCYEQLAELLIESELVRDCSVEQAMQKNLPRVFCPHGLGHMLGIQVHDVAGDQIDPAGTPAQRHPDFPFLRMVRPLRAREVVTIEPGLYFVELLLEKERAGEHSQCFNWPLIDRLLPLGGIRIEDDVVAHEGGRENLTRDVLKF